MRIKELRNKQEGRSVDSLHLVTSAEQAGHTHTPRALEESDKSV